MVHIDLKGAPPKFEFLERLLRFISVRFKHLVDGVLIEFEDMFPFTGFLKAINSPNCYSI
jgi:hexosaminidase